MNDSTFKTELIAFAKRYDVIFSFGGMLVGSLMILADKMPWWLLLVIVLFRETFAFLGMLSKEKDDPTTNP